MPSNQPIVLLREVAGERYLPIWIGAVEATAIAFAQQGVVPAAAADPRPARDVLDAARQRAQPRSGSPSCRDGVFYAELVFAAGVEVSARPSDAIALALRTGTPIFVRRGGPRRGRHRDPGRAGGRGREVPRVPRPDLARGLRGRRPSRGPCRAVSLKLSVEGCDTPRSASLTEPCARAYRRTVRRCNSTDVARRSARPSRATRRTRGADWRSHVSDSDEHGARGRGRPSRRGRGAAPRGEQGLLFDDDVSPLPERHRLPRPDGVRRRRHHLPPARLLGPHRPGRADASAAPPAPAPSGSTPSATSCVLKVVKRLLDTGVSLQQIRTAVAAPARARHRRPRPASR